MIQKIFFIFTKKRAIAKKKPLIRTSFVNSTIVEIEAKESKGKLNFLHYLHARASLFFSLSLFHLNILSSTFIASRRHISTDRLPRALVTRFHGGRKIGDGDGKIALARTSNKLARFRFLEDADTCRA